MKQQNLLKVFAAIILVQLATATVAPNVCTLLCVVGKHCENDGSGMSCVDDIPSAVLPKGRGECSDDNACKFSFLQCVEGSCLGRDIQRCLNDTHCGKDKTCQNGKCVRNNFIDEKCMTVKCSSGFSCKRGKCVPN